MPETEDALRKEVARLSAENETLRAALIGSELQTPAEWRLTRTEEAIFQMLLSRETVTKSSVLAALYGGEPRSSRIVDVFINKLRQKTRPHSVEIATVVGAGYRLLNRRGWAASLKAEPAAS